jgi:uncharacterized integral membrane protein
MRGKKRSIAIGALIGLMLGLLLTYLFMLAGENTASYTGWGSDPFSIIALPPYCIVGVGASVTGALIGMTISGSKSRPGKD